MRFEMASYFEDPEFKRSLQKYEDMVKSHVPAYFDGDELTDIAEYYASKGRESDADEVVRFGLSLHPDDIDLLIFKSRSLAIKGKVEEARKVYELITDQNDREVKFLLFDILIEEGNGKEADKLMEDMAAEEEYSMEVMTDIMQIYLDDDLHEDAKKWYERIEKAYDVEKLSHTNKRLRSILCDYYLTMNQPERCIPLLEEMVDESPYSVGLWNDLARCHLDMSDEEKAHEAVDFSLAIDDNDAEALQLKAACYRMSGNITDCILYMERAVATGNNFPIADLQLTKIYIDTRKYEKALEMCERIDARRNDLSNVFMEDELNGYMAISYMANGEEEKSFKKLNEVRNRFPNSTNTAIVVGHCALIYKDSNTAMEYFNRAIQIARDLDGESHFQTLFEVAGLLFDYKELEEAGKVYKEMIKTFPEESRIALYLAMYCFAYTRQVFWFYHCYARIRKELPELYAEFGHMSEFNDKTFDRVLSGVAKAINQGEIDIDQHLVCPE